MKVCVTAISGGEFFQVEGKGGGGRLQLNGVKATVLLISFAVII